MIISMTGYGKAAAELPGRTYIIEIKSLNSKGLDLSVKIPGVFREKEMEVRNLLSQRLIRGKIELYISVDRTPESAARSINVPLALQYQKELKELLTALNEETSEGFLTHILKMPDVMQGDTTEFDAANWSVLAEGIESALRATEAFRLSEGKILEEDLKIRVNLILSLLDSIEPFEQNRINDIRERIRTGFQNIAGSDQIQARIDENRFEQELIFYIERLDITEEKVRLKKHCDYFTETLNDPVSQGKKLGFICQEMGREINTIGSKASDFRIAKLVIDIKGEIEKIREQAKNLE